MEQQDGWADKTKMALMYVEIVENAHFYNTPGLCSSPKDWRKTGWGKSMLRMGKGC